MTDQYFVVDVNVLVSAFLFANSKPRQALDKAQNLGIILLSDAVLSELIQVLTRPKFDRYVSKQTREQLTDDLTQTALLRLIAYSWSKAPLPIVLQFSNHF